MSKHKRIDAVVMLLQINLKPIYFFIAGRDLWVRVRKHQWRRFERYSLAEKSEQWSLARTENQLHTLLGGHVHVGLYLWYCFCVHLLHSHEIGASILALELFNSKQSTHYSSYAFHLGLGDRHPSNLMLHRVTGKVAHIDFGDCFEVAMHREKFPEKIPFRLTRMLVNAMEVTGIEGSTSSLIFITTAFAFHSY